jgi:hypothetical protein
MDVDDKQEEEKNNINKNDSDDNFNLATQSLAAAFASCL